MLIKNYLDLSMETPPCHPGAPILSANFKLDTDVSLLFPYINAVIDDAQYFDKPHFVRFTLNGIRYALYPDNASAVPFETPAQAKEYINSLLEFLNDLYKKKDAIEPDHKKFKPIPVIDIYKILPGTNCKECGFATCMAFAAALSKGEVLYDACPDLNSPEKEDALIGLGIARLP